MKSSLFKREERWVGYACLLPTLVLFAIFFAFPLIFSICISFCDYSVIYPTRFIGIENYIKISQDPDIFNAFRNTAYYVFGVLPSGIAISLGLALLTNKQLRGISFFRAAFFLPVVTPMAAVSLIWMWIYNPQYGPLTYYLNVLGFVSPQWLYSPRWALPSIMIVGVWKYVGFQMIIYLAALQAIPQVHYEAARIDGANKRQAFWHITLPMLAPTTFFLLVIGLIHSFKVFTEVYVMTRGGPLQSTTVILYYIWRAAFNEFRMGYASALAYILTVIIAIILLLQFKFLGRRTTEAIRG